MAAPPLPNRTALNYSGGGGRPVGVGAPPLPFATPYGPASPLQPPPRPAAAHPSQSPYPAPYTPSYALGPPISHHQPPPHYSPQPHQHPPPAAPYAPLPYQQQPPPPQMQMQASPPRPPPPGSSSSSYYDACPPPSQSSEGWLPPGALEPQPSSPLPSSSSFASSSLSPTPPQPALPPRPHSAGMAPTTATATSTTAHDHGSYPSSAPAPGLPTHTSSASSEFTYMEPAELTPRDSYSSAPPTIALPALPPQPQPQAHHAEETHDRLQVVTNTPSPRSGPPVLSTSASEKQPGSGGLSPRPPDSPSAHRRSSSLPFNQHNPPQAATSPSPTADATSTPAKPFSRPVAPPKRPDLSSSASSPSFSAPPARPPPTLASLTPSPRSADSTPTTAEPEDHASASAPPKEVVLDEVPPEYAAKPLPCPPKKRPSAASPIVNVEAPVTPAPAPTASSPPTRGAPAAAPPGDQPRPAPTDVGTQKPESSSTGRPMATYQAAPGKLVQAFVPPKPTEQAAPKAAERPTIAPRPIAASAPPIREAPTMPAPQAATTIDLASVPKRLPPAPHSNGAYSSLAQSEPSLPTQRRAPPAVPPAQSKPCALAQAAPAPARKMPNKPLPPPVASSQSSPSAGAVTATPSPGHGLRPSPFPQQAAKPLPPVEVSKEKEAASERQNSFEGINTTISFVLVSQVIFTSEVDRFFLCTIEVKWGNAQWIIKRPYGQFQAFDAWTNHYVKTINQLPYPLPPAKKFVKPKEKNADKRAAEMKKYIAGISSFVHLFLAHKVGRAMVLRFFAPIQAGDVKDPSVSMPFDVPPSLPQGKLLGW